MSATITSSFVVYSGLNNPRGLEVDAVGDIYVANTGANKVISIDSGGLNYTEWGTGLNTPNDVALLAGPKIHVTDTGNSKVAYIDGFGTSNIISDGDGIGIALDSGGNIYVAYPADNYVRKYDKTTYSLLYAYTVTTPWGVALDSSDNVYITRQNINAVEKYDNAGNFITSYSSGIGLSSPRGVAVDSAGNIYVASSGNNKVVRIDTSGNTLDIGALADLNGPWGVAVDSAGVLYVADTGNGQIKKYTIGSSIVCFKEDTKILTDKGYKLIKDLRKGDLVKTLKNDFKPIDMIAKKKIFHHALKDRIKDQLYKCSKSEYPEVFEDLVITGAHSILVDKFESEEQKQKTIEVNGKAYVTDGKYRLPACVDSRTSVYETPGTYTIYHLALEHDDYYMNYGIYANGLLVETCSKRYLKELSEMTLIE